MRDLRPITTDRVADLVGRSGSQACTPTPPCAFWQTLPHNGNGDPADPHALVVDWVRTVTGEWGPPGRIAYVDDRALGHVLVAPARHVPRLAAFPTAPADPGTLMLLTVAVEARNAHAPDVAALRKALVQSAAKDALRRKVRSIDVIAVRSSGIASALSGPPHPCVLDADFLERVGFHVKRDHPVYPRLRLDLRNVVTIRDEAAAAVRRALARVPGVPGVRPVPDQPPAAHRDADGDAGDDYESSLSQRSSGPGRTTISSPPSSVS